MGNDQSQLIETARRRRYVLQLRRQGANYRQIRDKCLEKWSEERLPSGWDERYAYKDLQRELKKVREEVAEAAEDVMALELQRLDEMLSRLYPVALGSEDVPPDPRSADRVLKIMKRRAKMLGLDAPEEHEVTGKDGEPLRMQWIDPESMDENGGENKDG